MFIDDILKGGYWPLQHFDTRFHPELRIMRFGARIVEDQELRIAVPERHSTGPVMGGFLWGSTDYQDRPPIWSFAAPCVRAELEPRDAGLGASRSWLLEGGGDWLTPAPKLEAKDLITPFAQKFPLDWPGVALCSVNADKQNDLALPGFAGLVAPHRAGDPELGSPVWDIDGGRVDPIRRARLQSMMRVYRYPAAACVALGAGLEPGGLAWQLGTARAGLGGAGMVADDDGGGIATIERGALLPQVLATASHRAGGPLHTGGPGDQHNHGTTPDGEAVNSLHLSTSSIFLGHGGDAPLRFEGLKQPEQSAPLTVPAHLRLDAAALHRTPCGVYGGLWVWQAESFIAKIPDRFPPPEDGEPLPPRTEPREPGDTVISGADGWIAGGGVPPQIAPEQQVRQLAGTPMELAAPALVFRPQNFSTAAIDLRNLPPAMFDGEASKQWSEAPAVLRLEAAGTMTGPEWSRTTEPGRGRYAAGGTGSGTLWAMAPELGLELRGVDGLTTSSSELGLWGVDLTIAAPSATDSATAVNGYRIKNVSTAFSQRIQIDSLDANGADNHRIEIQGPNIITTGGMFQGDSIRLDDGSFYLTLEPAPGALTANRLAYLRDRTFYVGEHLVTNAISASGRIVTLRSYAVDCSGGAIALELPAATSANEGDELEVIDSSGDAATNNITINRVGSDTIRGSTSYVIASDYGVVRLRCGSSTWHVVGEVIT